MGAGLKGHITNTFTYWKLVDELQRGCSHTFSSKLLSGIQGPDYEDGMRPQTE